MVLDPNRVAGFDLNRYTVMYFQVWNSNQATRAQAEGRIDRANNDAKAILYRYYYPPGRAGQYEDHERERAQDEVLRDAQSGDDSTRRQYDAEHREKLRQEAEEAHQRAEEARQRAEEGRQRAEEARQRAEEGRQRAGGGGGQSGAGPSGAGGGWRPGGPPPKVAAACALLGVEYTEVYPALRTAAQKAKRRLGLKWHPDRWVTGTAEEKEYAEAHSKRVNNALDDVEEYVTSMMG
jgi:hypothetical protein